MAFIINWIQFLSVTFVDKESYKLSINLCTVWWHVVFENTRETFEVTLRSAHSNLLRDIGSLRSQSVSLNLPKQLHPAFILIITSSRVWFSIITVWPRYLYLSTFSITSFSITIVSSDLKLVIYFVFPLCMLSPIFLLPWFLSKTLLNKTK